MYKTGDIILTPFPFTDLSGHKVRPAIVLGSQYGDITVCFVSSVVTNKINSFDVVVNTEEKDFAKTGLKIKSIIKITKIATLDKAVVIGKIGFLGDTNLKKVKKNIKSYFVL